MSRLRYINNLKLLYLTVVFVCFSSSIISLFLPYLERINVRSGDLDLPIFVSGSKYFIAYFVVVSIGINLLVILISDRRIFSFLLSLLTALLVSIIRKMIHFQGFIDHDYDSKTGSGFLLLFVSCSLLLLASSVALFYSFVKRISDQR